MATFFKFQKSLCGYRSDKDDKDRLFGHYFRVAFYGAKFGELNQQTFIYREKLLTHLYELTTRLEKEYNAVYNRPIEMIKESGAVNPASLDGSKLYIQITFVEPYFPKSEHFNLQTKYDFAHHIKTFYFDTPFTKGSSKAQGSLGDQWLRRTLLTLDSFMPSVVKMAFVRQEKITEKEFMPVRVAYRQLRTRVVAMVKAVEASDYRQMQQLLHGSLLVQVNEGPYKMAEVFLSGRSHEEEQYARYADKLRVTFKEFLAVCQAALKVHGKWTKENTEFKPLQDELESGFQSLEEKVAKFL
jgi:hypothetical protein